MSRAAFEAISVHFFLYGRAMKNGSGLNPPREPAGGGRVDEQGTQDKKRFKVVCSASPLNGDLRPQQASVTKKGPSRSAETGKKKPDRKWPSIGAALRSCYPEKTRFSG